MNHYFLFAYHIRHLIKKNYDQGSVSENHFYLVNYIEVASVSAFNIKFFFTYKALKSHT